MLEAIENSDLKTAAAIQRKSIPKVHALFSVPSPAPVKAVLNHLGFEVGPLRLPLVACTSEEAKRIIKVVLEEDVEATRETKLQVSFVQIIKKMKLKVACSAFLVE